VKVASFQNEREQLAQLEWLFQQDKFAEGLARTETALREHPASFHLKFQRYRFLRQLQQNAPALHLLRELHAMSGDNILVVRELADLLFQQKQAAESLVYYKKLLFLDSFNGQAQERVKQLQGMLETGVSDRLADTRPEFRPEPPPPDPEPVPAAAPETAIPVGESQFSISLDEPSSPAVGEAAPAAAAGMDDLPLMPDFAAAAEPAGAEAGLNYQTESAAELYFKQGMYREALAIYKGLFEKSGRSDHFHKIQAILQLLRADRAQQVSGRLLRFLELLQARGKQFV
jgi:tetratricopeptide (TPR) repeat protein